MEWITKRIVHPARRPTCSARPAGDVLSVQLDFAVVVRDHHEPPVGVALQPLLYFFGVLLRVEVVVRIEKGDPIDVGRDLFGIFDHAEYEASAAAVSCEEDLGRGGAKLHSPGFNESRNSRTRVLVSGAKRGPT